MVDIRVFIAKSLPNKEKKPRNNGDYEINCYKFIWQKRIEYKSDTRNSPHDKVKRKNEDCRSECKNNSSQNHKKKIFYYTEKFSFAELV